MDETILLQTLSGDAAVISAFGAELSSWRAGGHELIWAKNPAIWNQTAPVLFPVVGWTRDGRVRVDGRAYPLALHGFAWKKMFRVTEQRQDFVRLELTDDAETQELYPFAFRFEVEFTLVADQLENRLIVTNRGDHPLPYACGLHPAFRWPLAGSTAPHKIVFDEVESPLVPIIGPGGLLSSPTRQVPLQGRDLPLAPQMFARDALCFLNLNSKGFSFDNGEGKRLRVDLTDFPHVGFWTLPPAPYLCLEPWTGHGDPEDFRGDLFDKPSMRVLAAGESAHHAAVFRFQTGVLD
jgi:galactose mutarotase-like enzyme